MHKGAYGSIGGTYHQLKYYSPNRSNKQKTKSHTKEPTFHFRKWRFIKEKQIRRMGQKQKRTTEIAAGTRQKNK